MTAQLQNKNVFLRAILVALVLSIAPAMIGNANAAGDVAAGEQVFKKCKTCHMIGDGAKSRQGPLLTGIVDRPAGIIEGFRYSSGLKAKAEEGLVWTEENLTEYLKAPRIFIPRGKMAFAGLKRPEDIENILAYLRSFQ